MLVKWAKIRFKLPHSVHFKSLSNVMDFRGKNLYINYIYHIPLIMV